MKYLLTHLTVVCLRVGKIKSRLENSDLFTLVARIVVAFLFGVKKIEGNFMSATFSRASCFSSGKKPFWVSYSVNRRDDKPPLPHQTLSVLDRAYELPNSRQSLEQRARDLQMPLPSPKWVFFYVNCKNTSIINIWMSGVVFLETIYIL